MRFVSKEQLKKDLPLAYVVSTYGVNLDHDTCTGMCPFHNDENPSFRLYVADDGVERWHCFAGETRVITKRGVSEIEHLAGGTHDLLSSGHWISSEVRSFGVQDLLTIHLSRNGVKKTIRATPEHRWIVKTGKTATAERTTAELREGSTLASTSRRRYVSDLSPDGIKHGFCFGDGHESGIVIHGEKNTALSPYFYGHTARPRENCCSLDGCMYYGCLPKFFKTLPSIDETPSYLLGWLAGYLAADGNVADGGSGKVTIGSSIHSNVEFIRDVCTRLGIFTHGVKTSTRKGYGDVASPMFSVTLSSEDLFPEFFLRESHRNNYVTSMKTRAYERRHWVVERVEDEGHREEVFCAIVPDTHTFALEDHILTGNCFPCQEGGDIYDFLLKMDPVLCPAFPEALTRAEELYHTLPRGWREDPNRPKPSSGYDTGHAEDMKTKWPLFIGTTSKRALDDPHFAAGAGLIRHDEYDDRDLAELSARLVTRWRWGVDDSGVITVPHYGPDSDQPTGVKLRAQGEAGSRKWALPGSKYPYLYGSWLEPQHNYVLLTEGESDAVWADLQPYVPCDVRALPSGASSWNDAWVRELLDTWERIFICLDPDLAGVNATRRWVQEMQDAVPGPAERQIWLCSLPSGRDLRDARPDVKQLLDDAVLPPTDRGAINTDGDVLNRMVPTNNGAVPKQLASWYFEPVARLKPNHVDGLSAAYEVKLLVRGAEVNTTISADDMSNKSRFSQWTGREGLAAVVNDNDILELNSWTESQAAVTPEKYQTRRVGIHPPPDRYHWAGSSLVVPPGRGPSGSGYMGHLPWVWRGMPEHAASMYFTEESSKYPDYRWIQHFIDLSVPGFTEPLLGWLIATLRRPELTYFPICSITGSSGSGKSTISRLALQMMGSRFFGSLSGDTPMKLQVLCSSTTSLPVFVDEWTKISRSSSLETMKSIITYIYEGGATEKYSSGSRLDRDVYVFTSPVLLAGEMEFIQTREVERMIPLSLKRSEQNHEALHALLDQPLDRFGWHINDWFIRVQRDDPGSLPPLPRQDPEGSRAEYNWAVVMHGWELLRMFLETEVRPNVYDQSLVPTLRGAPTRDEVRNAFNEIHMSNSYDDAISAAYGVNDTRYGTAVVVDNDQRGTWINTRLVCKIARDLEIDLPGGERAMTSYLKERVASRGGSIDITSRRRYDILTGSYTLMKFFPEYFPHGLRPEENEPDARISWTPPPPGEQPPLTDELS